MRPTEQEVQLHIANVAIGASTVRGRGNTGVAGAARHFLAHVELRRFSAPDEEAFLSTLCAVTDELLAQLPHTARHWGIARKCTNIFLRDAFYNRFICEPLLDCEPWLEIPLDSVVAKHLLRADMELPRWQGVKRLDLEMSRRYQRTARRLADQRGYAKVYLDSVFWPQGRTAFFADATHRV